jgi:ribonucleotide monophosphatase NagD (HAD superfamily)
LVFSKDRDTDKVIPKDRLTALMYLVYSAAQDESHLFRLSRHVVEKLRTSSIGNSDQLVTQFIRATKLLNQGTTLEKFKRVLVMKDREYLLDDGYSLKRRELENLKIVPSSLAIKNFGDEKTYEEYKTALKTIKETYDRLATNPDLSFQAFIQELPENEKARDIFMHLFSGLDGRVVLNTSTEGKPEDAIILSLVEHVERLLGSHYLVGFARSNSSKGLAA